jgi:hypothetical protein
VRQGKKYQEYFSGNFDMECALHSLVIKLFRFRNIPAPASLSKQKNNYHEEWKSCDSIKPGGLAER